MAKILIIDDDRIIRKSLFDGLTISGNYDVTVAEDGFDGIEIARELRPDLIICDIDMPRLDGHGVIEALQQDPLFAKTPFIFLTGQSTRESIRKGMALGADDYIAKPFKMAELLEAMEARLTKISRLETHFEQKLEVLRDNILLALPHELRSPLSLILGYAEILANPDFDFPQTEVNSLADMIFQSGKRLHHLVENYIIYAQIELILTEPERVNRMRQLREAIPNPVIERVVREQMEKHGRSAHLTLNATEEMLPISASNLEKIGMELVDNAFKFSPIGTEITVSTVNKDGKFLLEIGNQGQGLTPDQIDAIGIYMQFERKIQEQQGSGMGLIIAKRLTELYGGTMTIQSKLGIDTKVVVTLPS